MRLWFAGALACGTLISAPVCAQTVDDAWRTSATLYLWASAYDNEVTDKTNGQTSESSADFGDILDDLSGVFIGQAEVGNGRIGFFADLVYLKVSADRTTERGILGPIETESEAATTTATVAGYWRVIRSGGLDVDLVGGVRFVELDLELDVAGAGPGLTAAASESTTQPIVGVRATQVVGPRGSVTGYADYGGFDDEITVWQLVGVYNYRWTPDITVFGGYRHFALEVDKPRLDSDVTFSGPVLGLTYHF